MNERPAKFEPYVERDGAGRVTFANRLLTSGGRFRMAMPVRRRRHKTLVRSLYSVVVVRSILQSSRIAAARRWLPCNPLLVHLMRVEDARLVRRPYARAEPGHPASSGNER